LLTLLLSIAKSILSYASRLGFRVVGLSMSANLRLEYLSAVFKLPISTLDTLPSGQVSNTITTNANILQQGISDKLGSLIQVISLLFSAIGVAFTFSWSLTLVTSSVLIFIIFCHWVFMPIIVKRRAEADFADEKASSIAGEVLGSIRMIVACGAEERIAGRYSGWVEESRRRGLKISPYIGGQYAPCKSLLL
jgi:ATP-binding cassette subfamily B (MDR/TAP) protein 1